MKIRAGFVSNSSSSSFVAFGVQVYGDDGYEGFEDFYNKLGITASDVENSSDYEFSHLVTSKFDRSVPDLVILPSYEGPFIGIGLVGDEPHAEFDKKKMLELPNWQARFEEAFPELGEGYFMGGIMGTDS